MNKEEKVLNEQLNNLKQTLQFDGFFGDKTFFKIGNSFDILNQELKEKCYYGKVAVFSYQKTFLALSPFLKNGFSENKILPMEYLFNDEDDISIENLSKLFLLPDTIRAVIVLDSELSDIGGYFAGIKKIPLFIFTCGLNTGEALENSFYIKNGQQYDLFTINAKKYVIIDFNLIDILKKPYSDGFDYVMNNLVSLIDYKTNSFFTKKPINADLYNEKNKAIVSAFSCTKKSEAERLLVLSIASITCGMVNALLGEEYVKNNSLINLLLLYGKAPYLSKEFGLYFSKKVMDLLGLICEADQEKLFIVKDYNEIAEKLSEDADLSQNVILDNLLKQLNAIKESNYSINDFADSFGGEILSLSTSLEKIRSIHIALGGKEFFKIIDKNRFKFAVKYAGAMSENISGLSLLIHSGINELI